MGEVEIEVDIRYLVDLAAPVYGLWFIVLYSVFKKSLSVCVRIFYDYLNSFYLSGWAP